jgi:bacillopeptidase F (M6 metalloprotease family)
MDNITLKSAETAGPSGKAIRIDLPPYTYPFNVNTPHSGNYEWYSGKGDNLNNVLTRKLTLPTKAQLKFWTWYDIELEWDYGFVEVSNDNGTSWSTVNGSITTNSDPNGNNQEGNGITGSSGGWVHATFDLSHYGGQKMMLRLRYKTDGATQGMGWTIDDISIKGFSDDVESGNQGWDANGWTVFKGRDLIKTSHYYMAEWRTPRGFDVSMNNWYNIIKGNTAEMFSAGHGMLLWYRNSQYNENSVGLHPWAGGWQVVDSHPYMILANSTKDWANFLFNPDPDMDMPFRTRIQLADAAFGLQPTKEQPIKSWFEVLTDSKLPSLSGVPIFDDSKTYLDDKWEPWFYTNQFSTYIRNSINSVDTPAYGLKITVKDENSKAGIINVDFSKLPLNIISILPATRTVSNDVGEKRTFIINVDQKANITWFINGTKVQSNTSVSTSTYLNESAAQGSWNVTSVASNINGTDVYSWNWTVRKNSE